MEKIYCPICGQGLLDRWIARGLIAWRDGWWRLTTKGRALFRWKGKG